jgi:hypothetical protein
LRRESSARIRNAWLSAGCALALICAAAAPCTTAAQESGPASNTAGNKTETQAKTATSKSRTNATAKNTRGSASTAKPHSASHAPASAHPKATSSAAARNGKSKQASSRKNSKHKMARGQQKIDPERAQAIQEALIREHYLSGQAAGTTWNQTSEDAMRRYQSDHGWQSKTVPDSRALISLGLGPSHDHLLNPESAMTTAPESPRAASLTPASHSADPGARLITNPAPPADSSQAPSSGHDPSGPQ